MRITKKFRVRLNAHQIAYANEVLELLTRMWNEYVTAEMATGKGRYVNIHPFEFDKNGYKQAVASHPEYRKVNAKSRTSMFAYCHRAMKAQRKSRAEVRFRVFPVQSIFFEKLGVKLIDVDGRNWFRVPMFGNMPMPNQGYVTHDDMQYVTGGVLVTDGFHWYVSLRMDVPDDYYRELSRRIPILDDVIGIDVGIKALVTYSSQADEGVWPLYNGAVNPGMDDFCKEHRAKIARLQEVIAHKIKWNLIRYGYDPTDPRTHVNPEHFPLVYRTREIMKFRTRIAKLHGEITRHKTDAINRVCHELALLRPRYIVIEELSPKKMIAEGYTRSLRRFLGYTGIGQFRQTLKWQCQKFHTGLLESPAFYPSTRECSACGNVKDHALPLTAREYVCEKCGLRIDRDVNAARNLRRYGLDRYIRPLQLGDMSDLIELVNSEVPALPPHVEDENGASVFLLPYEHYQLLVKMPGISDAPR